MIISQTVSIVVIAILTIIVAAQAFFYYKKYVRLVKAVANLVMEKELLLDKIDTLNLETSKEVNEGFIKFLSESREAAFDYIEDVQTAIQNYVVAIENKNFNDIAAARMELFSYLPESSETRDV